MAVPKRKMSRSNTRARRSQWKATPVQLVECSNRACKAKKPQHVACPECGQYAGRQVVEPA
ncbi:MULTISPECIES: 50S ribosomal protein L32 [Prauserella]|uniref:Large ribosomal subunit protein bL32 n=4 Tax=Prauserella TaxID=142577 RepID=A0A660CH46_9PSEU|nr:MULTISPECIES: 50S ribosomal protein L32 [Prauserella]KID31075.1 ribosomal protein L32 [Prauserella sp. Am3]KMS65953.1 50S ribosomal protein L32 [Streptomyces regensis]MBB3661447.1 large subunit ribosomal protein L32 [Prauserella sediminis]MCP2179090.1 large subunit ribosomal protein L32 [Prauserella alba]MCR3719368.1 large subunit ribosomal protein L32 [Prauserella flava]